MEITTYSNFRKHLKKFMDLVSNSRAPLYVTRTKGEDLVVLSKEDYESMQETLYLLSNKKNAERLFIGIDEYEQGKGIEKSLIEI